MISGLGAEVEAIDICREAGRRLEHPGAVRAVDVMGVAMHRDRRFSDPNGSVEREPAFAEGFGAGSAQVKIICDKGVYVDVNALDLAEDLRMCRGSPARFP